MSVEDSDYWARYVFAVYLNNKLCNLHGEKIDHRGQNMFNRALFLAVSLLSGSAGFQLIAERAVAQTAPASAPAASSENAARVASPEEPPTLAEVIVTARRREENRLKVPIAVSAVSSAEIEAADIKSEIDLARFTPGLYVETGTVGGVPSRYQTQLTFRGLSTDNGVVFIDGAPYTGNGTPDITDVARVEVLEGPQSVYFGRSTFAGAINYVTKVPGDTFRGQVSEDAYSDDGFDTRLKLEGPLAGDLLRARVNLRSYSFGGQYEDGTDHQQLGAESTKSATLSLASSPSSQLNLSAFYSYNLDEDGPPSQATLRVVGPGATLHCNLGGTSGPYYCGQLPNLSGLSPGQFGSYAISDPNTYAVYEQNVGQVPVPFSTSWLKHFGLKRQVQDAHVRADYDAGSGWDISLLGGFSKTKSADMQGFEGFDTSATTNPFLVTNPAALAADCAAAPGSPQFSACYRPQHEQLSTYPMNILNDYNAEFRVSSPSDDRLRGTFGLSYFEFNSPISSNIALANVGLIYAAGGAGLLSSASTPAIFGGLYYDITGQLKLSAEARYQWDGITQQEVYPTSGAPLSHEFTSFSPRITLDFSITPSQLVYATYSKGYKPGGFNAALVGQPASVLSQLPSSSTTIPYQQEEIDNYEVGNKAKWLDNRLQTTLTLYYMIWKNGQVTNDFFVAEPNNSETALGIVTNVGKVDMKGVEFQANYAVTANLSLLATFDFSDDRIIDYVYAPGGTEIRNSTNVDGNQLPQRPKTTISVSPTYTRPLVPGWDWYSRLDYFYRSRVFVDPTNVAWIGDSNTVNLRFGVNNDRGLRMEAYVNNLFDNGTLTNGAQNLDGSLTPNPAIACPPCISSTAQPVAAAAVGNFNVIGVGLPVKRELGIRASYAF